MCFFIIWYFAVYFGKSWSSLSKDTEINSTFCKEIHQLFPSNIDWSNILRGKKHCKKLRISLKHDETFESSRRSKNFSNICQYNPQKASLRIRLLQTSYVIHIVSYCNSQRILPRDLRQLKICFKNCWEDLHWQCLK